MSVIQSYLNKAKSDKFLMIFDLPPILKPYHSQLVRTRDSLDRDSVQFSIHGTVIPSVTVKANDVRFAGSGLYISSHSKDSYSPVSVKFNIDSMYSNYLTIYKWLNLLHDQYSGVYNGGNLIPVDPAFNDYQTDITVYGLGEGGIKDKRIKFTYTKAFVSSIDEVQYNQQAEQGEELQCGFTFLYSQMHVEPIFS